MSHTSLLFVPLHSGQGGQGRHGGHYGQCLQGGQGRYDGHGVDGIYADHSYTI